MDFSKKLYQRYNEMTNKNKKILQITKFKQNNKDYEPDSMNNITEQNIRDDIDNTLDAKYNDILYRLTYDLEDYANNNGFDLKINFNDFKELMLDNSSALFDEYENLKQKMNTELFINDNELKQLDNYIEKNNPDT